MNRLRRALNDSADSPRYIETIPGRGYRFIGTVGPPESLMEQQVLPVKEAAPATQPHFAHSGHRGLLWVIIAAGSAIVCFVLGWFFHTSGESPPWTVIRVTDDAGLSDSPGISPDGKLIAYSADSAAGNRDLFVKQVSGGAPIRLTFDGLGNTMPDFSPDGSRIVFRSNRSEGGIYEIPTFGGEERLIVRDGWNPKFSPDGSRIAYWVGDDNVAIAIPGAGAVWVIAASGGQPHRVGTSLTTARYPVWDPSGHQLLVSGYASQKNYDSSGIDWWLIGVDDPKAVRTGAFSQFNDAGLRSYHRAYESSRGARSTAVMPNMPRPYCWSNTERAVIFSARNVNAETFSLWAARLSWKTGRVSGRPTPITTGASNDVNASCALSEAIAFTNLDEMRGIWNFRGDLNAAKLQAEPERLVEGRGIREYPSLSRDGKIMVFASGDADHCGIWRRELETGKESLVANSPFVQRFPVISGSGQKVAFSRYETSGRAIYVSVDGAAAERVCQDCLRATDWSMDESKLLIFGGSPYQISLLDPTSKRQRVLFKHSAYSLLYGHFSPDGHWVSFTARLTPNRGRIEIAPIYGVTPVPESAWISIAEEGPEDWATWSPDGKTLYFTSSRDGHSCLWAQRIDAISHKPTGEAFPIQHLHEHRSYQRGGWSSNPGGFVMVLLEDRGNVWAMSRAK